jgi:PD-(D/E)XK nuclease superfamily
MSTPGQGTVLLAVGSPGGPWFGPRVFEDAARCPAKAAVALRGYELPPGSRPEPLAKLTGGAWLAAACLLKELASRGPTSAYPAGQHPVTDLGRLAASVLLREGKPVREFGVAAAEALLDAQAATAGAFDYYPAFIKMPFGPGEMHAGGAFAFTGPAGQWQIWRLRMTTAHPASDTSRGWAITAAYCLAGHLVREGQNPLRAVEAFELGATSGSAEHIGNWTRAELDAEFAALRTGTLRNMATDLRVKAGSHCANCTFVGNCPATRRIEGLLQLVPRQPTVRKITATDLRTHADCARRYQLLSLQGLPGEALTGEALLRGQSLDTWLHGNHMRGTACTEADIQRYLLENADEPGAAMARRHLEICPLADPDTSNGTLVAQTDVAALDAGSRVLLVARPDAIYQRGGAMVWRETKTRTALTPHTAQQLIETEVAAALYLTLLASGASGPPDALEWEELAAGGHELTALLTDDKDLVEAARVHVSAAVADLLSDSTFPPRIGAGCAGCAARLWCPDAP